MLGPDLRRFGSETIIRIFDEYYLQYPPFEGTELLEMLAKRSFYARQWALFLEDYPLVLSPFLLKPFFAPDRDTQGAEGVLDALGAAHWSFIMNFTGLPAGVLPTHIADLPQGRQPIGVQIAGQRWREDMVVDAMQAIEARIPSACDTLWAQMG